MDGNTDFWEEFLPKLNFANPLLMVVYVGYFFIALFLSSLFLYFLHFTEQISTPPKNNQNNNNNTTKNNNKTTTTTPTTSTTIPLVNVTNRTGNSPPTLNEIGRKENVLCLGSLDGWAVTLTCTSVNNSSGVSSNNNTSSSQPPSLSSSSQSIQNPNANSTQPQTQTSQPTVATTTTNISSSTPVTPTSSSDSEWLSKVRWLLHPCFGHGTSGKTQNVALFLSTMDFSIGYPLEGIFEFRLFYSRSAPSYSNSKSPSKFNVGVLVNNGAPTSTQTTTQTTQTSEKQNQLQQHHQIDLWTGEISNTNQSLSTSPTRPLAIQINGHWYHSMMSFSMPYDLKNESVGKIVLLQPTIPHHQLQQQQQSQVQHVPSPYGLYGFVRRDADDLIRFVKNPQHSIVLNVSSNGSTPAIADSTAGSELVSYLLPNNNGAWMSVWLPNRFGLVEYQRSPPADWIVPEDLKQRITDLELETLEIEEVDVTSRFENWFEQMGEIEAHISDYQFKRQQLQPHSRLCDDISEYVELLQQRSVGVEKNQQQQNSPIDNRELLVYLIREWIPIMAPLAVKKTEPLGRGALWIHSESTLLEWSKSSTTIGCSVATPQQQRQMVVTYSSQKVLKKSNDRFFDTIDKDEILKEVGEYNPRTHLLILISLADFQHSVLLPLNPSFDQCKRCPVVSSKVDSLIINFDFYLRKILSCEILESSIPIAIRKRN